MAKIGTAHVEIKPVLNEGALAAVVRRIEEAVAAAVARGMSRYPTPGLPTYPSYPQVWSADLTVSTTGTKYQTYNAEDES